MKLLTTSNPKILKGQKRGYLTAILHLAPYTLSGRNVCPMATQGCAAACLNTAGRGAMDSIQQARIRKTNFYFEDRPGFMFQLESDIAAVVRKAEREGLIPAIRLNGTSDIRWESTGIMEVFPGIQFYDYTKLPNRRNLPKNYHLTYSLAEGETNWRGHLIALENGYNVAVVLRGAGDSRNPLPFPPTWNGRPLIDGDESDLRFLDGHGNYVGLRAKGRAKRDTSGFVFNV